MQRRRFPSNARARAYSTRTCGAVHRVRGRVYREEDVRRICRLDLLPYRSESVLAVVAGPQSLASPGEKQGGKGTRRTEGLAGMWRRQVWEGGLYITAHEKRPSTKTFNFRSPSASSIQGV